jgi:hypothetical protein
MQHKMSEALAAVVPVIVILLALIFTVAPLSPSILLSFLMGALLVMVGMMLLAFGLYRLRFRACRLEERLQALKEQLEAGSVDIAIKVGQGGRTFGSVSAKEIADAVKEQLGLEIDRKKLNLEHPIRELGSTEVELRLHTQVTAALKVNVKEA